MRLSYSLVILKVKYFQSLDRIIGMCWKACANINNEKYIQKVVLVAKITKILFIESLQYTGLKALRTTASQTTRRYVVLLLRKR